MSDMRLTPDQIADQLNVSALFSDAKMSMVHRCRALSLNIQMIPNKFSKHIETLWVHIVGMKMPKTIVVPDLNPPKDLMQAPGFHEKMMFASLFVFVREIESRMADLGVQRVPAVDLFGPGGFYLYKIKEGYRIAIAITCLNELHPWAEIKTLDLDGLVLLLSRATLVEFSMYPHNGDEVGSIVPEAVHNLGKAPPSNASPRPLYCSNCGKQILANWEFCPGCGKRV